MVALWLFVSDHDVLSLQRSEHGEDVVEGKLVVIPGTLNARAIKVAHCILTGRQCVCVCYFAGAMYDDSGESHTGT